MQVIEFDGAALEEQRRILAVVDGGEVAIGRAKVGEEHDGFIKILEGQLALDAFVTGSGHRCRQIGLAVELERISALDFFGRRQARWRDRKSTRLNSSHL